MNKIEVNIITASKDGIEYKFGDIPGSRYFSMHKESYDSWESEIVKIKSLEIVEKRDYSIGYGSRPDGHAVETVYNVHANGIVKHKSGEYFNLGAGNYFIDSIKLNKISLDNWNKIISLVIKNYLEQ